jgi:hypothetical protein
MAKLKGILKIEGTLDELTFYKTQDGHLVKTKGGVSADRIANDPNFSVPVKTVLNLEALQLPVKFSAMQFVI